jgi:thiamine biosynthesis lipoprotein
MRASWTALGTSVVLDVRNPAALDSARAIVEEDLAKIDRACSRFRPDSDLSRVNAAAGRMVHVDPLLVDAIEVALRAARLTDGDVDPALGEALVLAGYDRDWDLMCNGDGAGVRAARAPRGAVRALLHRGWQTIELDRDSRMVRVPPGVQLDLGATAKAWAADRAAHRVFERTGSGVLVSLGGDIATAGEAPQRGWRVHVTDDHRDGPHAPGQTVEIRTGGLATSSITARRWTRDGMPMHHIIDPGTGAPARGIWRTTSVAAGSCTDANIASTAALVRGEDALAWLQTLGLPARLVARDGRVHAVAGWPREPVAEAAAA